MNLMCEELKKFIGKEIFVDILGKDFAPKGILTEVNEEFIKVGSSIIPISSIASFKLAKRGGYNDRY